ncbi:MAG: ubiquitin-like domain-containing protein [Actinomycetota bacterium]
MRGVLRVLLTLAFAATSITYLLAEKRVTLTDNGRVREVKTFAVTVGSALARQGVQLGPKDRVLPSRQAELALGTRVEVRRAKEIVIVLNGARRVEKVTGQTVSDVLQELSLEDNGAVIDPAPKSAILTGDEIVVAQPASTVVMHDGMSRPVVTNAMTAGALLRELNVTIGPHDRVEPSIVAHPSAETPVKVIRVKEVVEKVSSKIPFKRVTEKSDSAELGSQKIKTKGVEGVRVRSYKTSYEDGKTNQRAFLGTEVVRESVDEVTLVGTRRPVLKAASRSDTGAASWYSQPGLMAAHPNLPFGTVVRVTNIANGKQVTVTIRDRGPFTGGRKIDLSDSAFKEIAPLGSGVINVKMEW